MVKSGTLFIIIFCIALFIAGPGIYSILVLTVAVPTITYLSKRQPKPQLANTHYLSQKLENPQYHPQHHNPNPTKPISGYISHGYIYRDFWGKPTWNPNFETEDQ